MTPLALIVQAAATESRAPTARSTRAATPKDLIFCARQACCCIRRMAAASAADQILVTSAAVEETVPDVQAARRIGAAVITRANFSPTSSTAGFPVGVAGTSGKSTTVGMIGWILQRDGKTPTIMNGAEMKNFWLRTCLLPARGSATESCSSARSMRATARSRSTIRESLWWAISPWTISPWTSSHPFPRFRVDGTTVVLNLDNADTAALSLALRPGQAITYSLSAAQADLLASSPVHSRAGIAFT